MLRMATSSNRPTFDIVGGTEFSTPFETGCVALDAPDADGNFDALDSDQVRCGFNLKMVTEVTSRQHEEI